MKDISEMSTEEVAALNAQNELELKSELENMKQERVEKASSALSLLMDVTASETLEIVFEVKGRKAILEVMANPPQKILTELFQTAQKAEKMILSGDVRGEDIEKTENRLCEILEYLTVHPKISKDVWLSGELSDEIAARVIFELMKYKVQKREVMEEELLAFRKDRRRVEVTGDRRIAKSTAVTVRNFDTS